MCSKYATIEHMNSVFDVFTLLMQNKVNTSKTPQIWYGGPAASIIIRKIKRNVGPKEKAKNRKTDGPTHGDVLYTPRVTRQASKRERNGELHFHGLRAHNTKSFRIWCNPL